MSRVAGCQGGYAFLPAVDVQPQNLLDCRDINSITEGYQADVVLEAGIPKDGVFLNRRASRSVRTAQSMTP